LQSALRPTIFPVIFITGNIENTQNQPEVCGSFQSNSFSCGAFLKKIPKSPVPFFDTLQEMANPYRQRVTSVAHLQLDQEPEDAVADYQYASEFLYSYRGSPDTFSTYRRELEHFLHWAWLVAGKSLRGIAREDIEDY